MQAGLVSGAIAMGRDPHTIVGYTVLAQLEKARATTIEKTLRTAELLDLHLVVPDDAITLHGEQLGTGYGLPTAAMREALGLMASLEGLLLDPVYSGKAFAGLIQEIRSGSFKPGKNVLFLMSGGLPSLFAYRGALS
jgi:D-cysteine desulfhydrase